MLSGKGLILSLMIGLIIVSSNAQSNAEEFNCCDDEDCLSTVTCNKECYVKMNSTGIENIGCTTDFEDDDELIELIKQKLVYVCSGENCNKIDDLLTEQKCFECDSEEDPNCLSNTALTHQTNCNYQIFSQCYERVTDSGTTTRGCLYDLDGDSFYGCLTGNGICRICSADDCNNQLIPKTRLNCLTCEETDSLCNDAPKTCSIYKEDDKCFIFFEENSETPSRKNCISSLAAGELDNKWNQYFVCSGNDCNKNDIVPTSKSCVECNSMQNIDCMNPENIESNCEVSYGTECYTRIVDDNLTRGCIRAEGAAAAQRCEDDENCKICEDDDDCNKNVSYCHVCDSSNCSNPGLKLCSDPASQCFAKYDNSKVEMLGCVSSLSAEEIASWTNANQFYKCTGVACNVPEELPESNTCVACSSNVNADCEQAPTSVTTTETCQLNDTCAVYIDYDQQIIRNCLLNLPQSVQDACEDDKRCQVCSGHLCNNQIFPSNRLACYQTHSEAAETCVLYEPDDACFAQYDNDEVQSLGCLSSLSSTEIDKWRQEKKLYECQESGCNSKELIPPINTCVSCNSNSDNACAQQPQQVATKSTCYLDDCAVAIAEDGHTVRGCLLSLPAEQQSDCDSNDASNCYNCSSSLCNNQIFPANRLKCYMCSSKDDPNCRSCPINFDVCLLYQADEACVARRSDNDVVERNCASNSFSCNETDEKNCQICSNANRCNTKEFSNGSVALQSSFVIAILLPLLPLLLVFSRV